MKSEAALCRAIAGLTVTVFDDGKPIRAIVTREMLEHLFGDIGEGQAKLLATFDRHAAAIGAVILERYRETGKDPVVLHPKARDGGSSPEARRLTTAAGPASTQTP